MSLEGSAARPLTLVDGGGRPASVSTRAEPTPSTPPAREDELDRLIRLARRVFDVPMVTIALPGPPGAPGPVSAGPAGPGPSTTAARAHPESPPGNSSHHQSSHRDFLYRDSFYRATLACPTVLLVPDARADPRFAEHRSVVGAPRIRFYAGRRLLGAGGRPVGTLSLRDTRTRLLSDAHLLLLEEIAGWVEQELARTAGRAAADEVHASLLPQAAPALTGHDLAAASVLVGGGGAGFYDWYPPLGAPSGTVGTAGTPTTLGWSLADVMGAPAATAVVAAGLRGALRAHGAPARDDPALTVSCAAAVIAEDLASTATFATLIAGLVDVDGRVSFADAGHGLALLVRADGPAEHLATSSLPLGIGEQTGWPTRSVQLAPGDTLAVFTEGLLGLYDGTLAGLGHVETLIRGADRAQDVIDRVRALTRRRGSTTDVTVLVVRRVG